MLHYRFLLRLAPLSAIAAALFALAQPALAQFVINEPTVEKGEFEFEAHGSVQSGFPGGQGEVPIRDGHELESAYGVTDFWKLELGLGLEQPVNADLQATTFEIQNTLEFANYEPWGAVFSVLASVELGLADQIPDAVTFGPLVQFGNDRVTLILNALFGKTFGEFRQTGLGFEYAAQFKVALIDQFSAGVEAFGELENLSNVPSFDQTNFRIGPMIYFSSGGGGDESKAGEGGGDEKGLAVAGRDIGVTADIGLLLGATEATPDVTVKWDLGISF